MLNLRQVGNGKKLGMYMDNTQENREKALLVMGAMLNGDLTEINTLNGIASMIETHLTYMSEKLEWQERINAEQERRNTEMAETIVLLNKKIDDLLALPAPQNQVEITVPKRKPGRASKAQIQEWEQLYSELTDLIWDFAVAKGYDTNNHKALNCARTNIYQGHRRKTGYYPRKALNHPSFGSDSPTKLARCVYDGYGESLAEYVREEIASLNGPSQITLRLNPIYTAH